jgi:hypothetical protein
VYSQYVRLNAFLLAILAGLALAASATAAEKRYDVSYVWSADAEAVEAYRDKVARVLGPAVAKDLRVVADGDLHGVIYLRGGDSAGAVSVSRECTVVCYGKKGLDAAAPVISQDWSIAAAGSEKQSKAVQPEASYKRPAAEPSKARSTASQAPKVDDLEAAVEAYIKELRRKGRISRDERTGWSVYDFTTGEKLVTINEESQFQAASLIKPFIAAAFFSSCREQGTHLRTEESPPHGAHDSSFE